MTETGRGHHVGAVFSQGDGGATRFASNSPSGVPKSASTRLPSTTRIRRVGLVVESLTQPAWAYATVERLLRDADVDLAVVALAERQTPPASLSSSLTALGSHGLAAAFDRLDSRLFRHHPDPFAARDITPLVHGVAMVTSRLVQAVDRWTLPAQDVARIRTSDPDVLLYLGEERLFDGAILSAAEHGLWYFKHGSPPPYRGAGGGFWETLAGKPTVGCTLVAASEAYGERAVYSSVFATHLTSVTRTRVGMYWTSTSFPSRAMKPALAASCADSRHLDLCTGSSSQALVAPGGSANREVMRRLPGYTLRVAQTAARKLLANRQWFVLVTPEQEDVVPSLARARRLVPPKDRFWADPHVIRQDGRVYLFVEELLFATGRGRIALLVIDESGAVLGPFTVLDRPYHLSYPFVFEFGGGLFMIPETAENGSVELYKCVRFPLEWEYVRSIMQDVSAADCTLLHHKGTWWLFTCMRESEGENPYTELHLFSSSDPVSGNWKAHPQNPVVCDERRARPAGPVFELRGRLYRPAQHFVDGQACAVSINEIIRLDEDYYEEAEAGCLRPDWERGLVGTHTMSRAQGVIAVDAFRWRCRFV